MTTAEFAASIEADPSRENLLMLADWLEDAGDPAAAGWRWLAETGKRPSHYGFRRWSDGRTGGPHWEWWAFSGDTWEPKHWAVQADCIQRDSFAALWNPGGWSEHQTRFAALSAAAQAYCQTLTTK